MDFVIEDRGEETFQTSGKVDMIECIELGTKITTEYGGKKIEAEVTSMYGYNNETLNIRWDGK